MKPDETRILTSEQTLKLIDGAGRAHAIPMTFAMSFEVCDIMYTKKFP